MKMAIAIARPISKYLPIGLVVIASKAGSETPN
jgi:hypothetical protein